MSDGAGQRVGQSVWAKWWLPTLLMALAACALLPNLGATGLWTPGELPVLDRTLAALGEPRANLTRSPWLPDQLRTWAYVASGHHDWGLRLPGTLACVGLVGLCSIFALRLGWSSLWAALAGCFALAFPLLLSSARTVLGNPTGELWIAAASLALVSAGDRSLKLGVASRAVLALVGAACWSAAVASLGIVLGGCLPLVVVAVADVARDPEHGRVDLPRPVVLLAWAGAAVAGFVGLWLGWSQGEGYIPLLGAAKDLRLLEDPTSRPFTDTLESLGYQLFPCTGLVVLGLLGPGRARWPALWLGVGLVMTSIWSLSYGPTVTPATIPAALVATAAVQRMFAPTEPIAARRLIVVCAVLAALVLGKDAARTPARIASPLLELTVLEFPAAGVAGFDVHEALPRMAKRFAALLLLAHLIAPPSDDQKRLRERLPQSWWLRRWTTLATVFDRLLTHVDERSSGLLRARTLTPIALVFAALTMLSFGYGEKLLTQVGRQLSIAGPLQRFAQAVERGEIPDPRLSLHRIRDPGLDYYGPGSEHEVFLANRSDLDVWLSGSEPRTALIRRTDLPAAFSSARVGKRALYVLDAEHHQVLLVANFLPPGHEDQNPLLGIIHDEPITLANETLVGWDPFVDLVAWEIEGELHRGSSATLHMVFRVHRPLPAGTKMYARLQKGKVSRVAAEPHDLTGGMFPPNFWREGDYVHHRFEFEVPWLEVLPGEHELIVGLRRSENSNLKISTPTGKGEGAFGVTVRGSKAEFATIGTVTLLW